MIFNVTGGGGTGGTLVVTAPAGVTCTVSKDGKTKVKTVDQYGYATFKGLDTGTWTVTISDGSQTSPARQVVVTTDYDVTMSFFSASIAVTYPEGSTCTCSDGTTTLTAPDTSGSYTFTIPNVGTWTVNYTQGEDSDSRTVAITTNGQSITIDFSRLVLFSATEPYYGTWEANTWASSGSTGTRYEPALTVGDALEYTVPADAGTKTGGIANNLPIDLSKYKTMHIKMYSSKKTSSILTLTSGLIDQYENGFTWLVLSKECSTTEQEYTYDLSNVDTTGYVFLGYWQNSAGFTVTVTEVYLEK